MLKRIVYGILYYYGIEKYTFCRKISDFGVDFSYFQTFFSTTLYYLIGNRGCNIFECCFNLPKTQ